MLLERAQKDRKAREDMEIVLDHLMQIAARLMADVGKNEITYTKEQMTEVEEYDVGFGLEENGSISIARRVVQ